MPLIRLPTIDAATDDTEPEDLPGTITSVTVTVTDAQIKTLPTTPVVIVPATETLNYSGHITRMPVVLYAAAVLTDFGGSYSNVDSGGGALLFAIGSDWSIDATEPCIFTSNGTNAKKIHTFVSPVLLGSAVAPGGTWDQELVTLPVESNDFKDNALVIAFNNSSSGNLTAGHSSNTLVVTIIYMLLEV